MFLSFTSYRRALTLSQGYCGSTSGYCGAGCQLGFGTCSTGPIFSIVAYNGATKVGSLYLNGAGPTYSLSPSNSVTPARFNIDADGFLYNENAAEYTYYDQFGSPDTVLVVQPPGDPNRNEQPASPICSLNGGPTAVGSTGPLTCNLPTYTFQEICGNVLTYYKTAPPASAGCTAVTLKYVVQQAGT